MKIVKITEIHKNPDNLRIIRDVKFKKLVQSLKDFPEMMSIRPIVVNGCGYDQWRITSTKLSKYDTE